MFKFVRQSFFLILWLFLFSLGKGNAQTVEYNLTIFGPVEDGGTSTDIIDEGLVTLGYYTTAVAGDLFNGTWIPLVGASSANPSKPSISFDNLGGAFTSSGDWEFSAIDTTPSGGQILSIRIDAPSGYFDFVSDPTWTWAAPSSPPPTTPDIDESGTWQGGNPGTVSLVPEPASYAFLAGLLGLGLAIARRRR